jgi:hypothetical protein
MLYNKNIEKNTSLLCIKWIVIGAMSPALKYYVIKYCQFFSFIFFFFFKDILVETSNFILLEATGTIWFDLLLSKNRQCYLSNTMVVHTVQYISITLLNDKKETRK